MFRLGWKWRECSAVKITARKTIRPRPPSSKANTPSPEPTVDESRKTIVSRAAARHAADLLDSLPVASGRPKPAAASLR